MYESFYGLKEKPFTLLPDPEFLYMSPKHERALTLLEYGMMNQAGFSVICGDTGAGKTTLIRRLLSDLSDDTTVGLITNTHQAFGDLIDWVLMAFGLDGEDQSKSKKHQMFVSFMVEQYALNKRIVLIVDEAQNIQPDMLEELRMLSNINADKDQLLQVILAGQPALRDTLRKPELMQFAQRISVNYYLESLSKEETESYIHHRLKVAGAEKSIFESEACEAIYRYSGGTPRLINLLCDTSMVYGFAEQTETITKKLVDDVVREQHKNSIVPTFNKPLTDEDIAKQEKVTSELIEDELIIEELESSKTENAKLKTEENKNTKTQLESVASAGAVNAGYVSLPQTEKASPVENSKNEDSTDKATDSNVTPIKQNSPVEESEEEKSMDEVYSVIEEQAELKAGLETKKQKTDKKVKATQEIDEKRAEEELDNEELVDSDDHHHTDVDELEKDFIKDEIKPTKEEVEETEAAQQTDEVSEIAREKSGVEKPAAEKTETEKSQVTKSENIETTEDKETEIQEDKVEEELLFEHVNDEDQHTRQQKQYQPINDAYPIIQLADNSKKNINVLVLGFAGGMLIAALMIMVAAYMMFSNGIPSVQTPQSLTTPSTSEMTAQEKLNKHSAQELERIKLQAIEKERDAAIAINKALERERDAALLSAKAQEEMRAAERRAAKIIAEQQRKSSRAVSKAKRRARAAELAAEKSKERERITNIRVLQAQQETKRLLAEQEKQHAYRIKIQIIKDKLEEERAILEEEGGWGKSEQYEDSSGDGSDSEIGDTVPNLGRTKSGGKTGFITDPCSSPSAKFMSTCKK